MKIKLRRNPLTDLLYFLVESVNPLNINLSAVFPDSERYLFSGITLPEIVAAEEILSPNESYKRIVEGTTQGIYTHYPLSHKKTKYNWADLEILSATVNENWDRYYAFYLEKIAPIEIHLLEKLSHSGICTKISANINDYTAFLLENKTLNVVLSPFMPAASALLTSWYIFGGIFEYPEYVKQSFSPRLIGHELTHLLFHSSMMPPEIDSTIEKNSLRLELDEGEFSKEVEEFTCIAMQHRLSIDVGVFADESIEKKVIDSTLETNLDFLAKTNRRMAALMEKLYFLIQNEFRCNNREIFNVLLNVIGKL